MNAREAMQALLDGKTIRREDGVVITPAEWGLLMKFDDGTCEKIVLEGCEVVEEYPLTYEQALRAMLDGKVVMCKEPFHGYAYRFHNGRFEDSHVNDCFTRWEQCGMPSFRQDSKWKVVE